MKTLSDYWRGKRVVVTGGTGFIGSFVTEMLLDAGASVRVPTRSRRNAGRFLAPEVLSRIEVLEGDFHDPRAAREAMRGQQILLHLAAVVGGIEYNIKHPASIFRDNLQIFMNSMEGARLEGLERVMVTSSACVYPRHCLIPTPESEGFKDRPEPTNEGYGWAKRMEEFLGESYAKEFGMSVAIARPYNCYGPRDCFDPERSHVIPALIRRIWRDHERPLRVWGSGRQSRSFLYVEDFARGLLEVAEKYPKATALNIGSDEETTIAELVGTLQEIHRELGGDGFEAVFDTTKPEGQPRRRCDTTLAEKEIGYRARWNLKAGLKKTVEWYLGTL
ncbi:MAG TPA: NAD-dependent epimerase/dehydratase family protein [Bdellovibrionota bacterium]|nr:NAD-dependent epimerase/dehydratase family protein [Bdellovibrionota bacterium]